MDAPRLWELLLPRLRDRLDHGLDGYVVQDFCDANEDTLREWKNDVRHPQGERLIRLWYLLRAAGSDSPEIEELPRLNAILGELFSHRIIDLETVAEICGISSAHSQHAFKILRGMKPNRPQFDVTEISSSYGEQLGLAQQALMARLSDRSGLTTRSTTKAATSPPADPAGPASKPSKPDVHLAAAGTPPGLALASLLGAALSLCRYLASEAVSPQERSSFRELLGQENLFEVYNLLHLLQSEQALSKRK